MADTRETIVVVCPGRGSYQRAELGYLSRYHADRAELLDQLDEVRTNKKQVSTRTLDLASHHDPALHNRSDNASALIYACSYADFLAIDRNRYRIVAVTGNSLGWYSALACAGVLKPQTGMQLVNTMGELMQQAATGGQILYPLVDDDWRLRVAQSEIIEQLIQTINAESNAELYESIILGGTRVFAGNDEALKALNRALPKTGSYPMRLAGHAAFHSPMMKGVTRRARKALIPSLFDSPAHPLLDGRGHIWQPYSTDTQRLWDYTLGHQLLRTYDFSRAIQNAVREFAPQRIVLTGPGNSLGSATAQALIEIRWRGLRSKQDFGELQQADPFILSMGLPEQRARVAAS